MGMMQPDGKDRRALYDNALAHARRSWSLAPDNIEARYWLAAAAGRRTHRGDPIYSARLGREVYEQAMAILAVDSTHGGAHHALGMLHAEVLRVPTLLRVVAGRTITNGLPRANEKEAERHLRRAVDLEPTMMIYLVDLANFYVRRGRARDAEDLARRIATTPRVIRWTTSYAQHSLSSGGGQRQPQVGNALSSRAKRGICFSHQWRSRSLAALGMTGLRCYARALHR